MSPNTTNVFDEFDRMLDGFFGAPVGRQTAAGFLPPYEVQENDQGYLLSFDLPGVPKDDIKIELKDNLLRISGERRRAESGTDKEGRSYSERRYGQFERAFTLPPEVNGEKIQAHFENGELHLMLPKTEKVKARNIDISTGATSEGVSGFFSKIIGRDKDQKTEPKPGVQ
jgi:HSP20 family protein